MTILLDMGSIQQNVGLFVDQTAPLRCTMDQISHKMLFQTET